jgi:hypothetical protein
VCIDIETLKVILDGASKLFSREGSFERVLDSAFISLCQGWAWIRSGRELVRVNYVKGRPAVTCEEKWMFMVPGKRFTTIVHTTYELLECYGDIEDCVKYESLLKPVTYRVVAVIEE